MFGAIGVYDREPQPALVGIRLSGVEVTPPAKDRQRPTGHARLGALFGPRGLSPPDRPTDGGLVTACRWAAWRATGSTRFSRRDRGKRLTAAIGVGSSDSPNPSTRFPPRNPVKRRRAWPGFVPPPSVNSYLVFCRPLLGLEVQTPSIRQNGSRPPKLMGARGAPRSFARGDCRPPKTSIICAWNASGIGPGRGNSPVAGPGSAVSVRPVGAKGCGWNVTARPSRAPPGGVSPYEVWTVGA